MSFMILYGKQLFLHVIKQQPSIVKKVYLTKECDKRLFSQIKALKVPIERSDFKKAQALAHGGNHQGFLMEINDLQFASLDDVKNGNFLVFLYGLSDVGNIGAICRSAYVFGADAVIVGGVKSLNLEGVLRTSSAAALNIPIVLATDALSALNELKQKDFSLYGSDMSGESVLHVKFNDKKVLIVGSEGEGIPKKALQKCDSIVKIDMKREFDSLNVSAATAILCDRIVNG